MDEQPAPGAPTSPLFRPAVLDGQRELARAAPLRLDAPRSTLNRSLWLAATLLLAAALLGGRHTRVLVVPGRLVSASPPTVVAPLASGRYLSVTARAGDRVDAGDVLATYTERAYSTDATGAPVDGDAAGLAEAGSALAAMERRRQGAAAAAAAEQERIESERTANTRLLAQRASLLTLAEERDRIAEDRYRRIGDLADRAAIAPAQVRTERDRWLGRRTELIEARMALERARRRSVSLDSELRRTIAAAAEEEARLRAERDALRERVRSIQRRAERALIAPHAGRILSVSAVVGGATSPAGAAVLLAPSDAVDLRVELNLPDGRPLGLEVGIPVSFIPAGASAWSVEALDAEVVSVEPDPEAPERFRVLARPEIVAGSPSEDDPPLRPGLPVVVNIPLQREALWSALLPELGYAGS